MVFGPWVHPSSKRNSTSLNPGKSRIHITPKKSLGFAIDFSMFIDWCVFFNINFFNGLEIIWTCRLFGDDNGDQKNSGFERLWFGEAYDMECVREPDSFAPRKTRWFQRSICTPEIWGDDKFQFDEWCICSSGLKLSQTTIEKLSQERWVLMSYFENQLGSFNFYFPFFYRLQDDPSSILKVTPY